ncbi:hypothetical protein AB4370_07900 [Vibrio cyclitrophicus]|uniref:hypothetical protein n=1 Tax=Vibrio cyclitrophicus TaxID=47951 RepID=UPI000C82BE51|nr:hypothetical protein [Vibrio cyclitrophicus]PMH40940.1 hypothetical protein BCU69_14835 [Vibrio cyclitrophicus]PMH77436.1 hypothetical protein BCU59_00415 [Vibrio cyclitrophicus]
MNLSEHERFNILYGQHLTNLKSQGKIQLLLIRALALSVVSVLFLTVILMIYPLLFKKLTNTQTTDLRNKEAVHIISTDASQIRSADETIKKICVFI